MQMPASTGCRYSLDITMNTFSLSAPASGGAMSSAPAMPDDDRGQQHDDHPAHRDPSRRGHLAGERIAMNRARMCGCPG